MFTTAGTGSGERPPQPQGRIVSWQRKQNHTQAGDHTACSRVFLWWVKDGPSPASQLFRASPRGRTQGQDGLGEGILSFPGTPAEAQAQGHAKATPAGTHPWSATARVGPPRTEGQNQAGDV